MRSLSLEVDVMKRAWLLGLAPLFGLMLFGGNGTYAADDQKTQKQTANKPAAPAPEAKTVATAADHAKSSAPHLPHGWAHLNLSNEQHQQAVAVLQKYAPQIKQLQAQIDDLRKKREAEMTALLSDKQRTQLAEAKAAEKTKAAEKAKATVAGKANGASEMKNVPAAKNAAKSVTTTAAKPVVPSGAEAEKKPNLEELKARFKKFEEEKKARESQKK